jgi:hypothetical protein
MLPVSRTTGASQPTGGGDVMAASRLNREDAEALLAGLQQTGEGWWMLVGTAVNAGAPKALGIDRREFVRRIGQRLIDPEQAIIELFQAKHSQTAIAEILSIHGEVVSRVLVEAGLIKPTRQLDRSHAKKESLAGEGSSPAEPSAGAGSTPAEPSAGAGVVDSTAVDLDEKMKELEAQVKGLETAVADQRKAAKATSDAQRNHMKDLRDAHRDEVKRLNDALRKAKRNNADELTEQERERIAQEQLAQQAVIDAEMVPAFLENAANHISVAVGELETANERGVTAKHAKHLRRLDGVVERLMGELEVAKAMADDNR